MTPHSAPLRFGYFLVPNHEDPLLEIAPRAERLGLVPAARAAGGRG